MKVLMVVGSPHKEGCVYTALSEVASSLNAEGIGTDFFWISNKPIGGGHRRSGFVRPRVDRRDVL